MRCYDLAVKGEALNEEEQHSLNRLNSMYPAFSFTAVQFKQMSNFGKVHETMERVLAKKAEIIEDRVQSLVQGTRSCARACLQQMKSDIEHRREQLMDGDLETLSQRQADISKRLQNGEGKIELLFEQEQINLDKGMHSFDQELRSISQTAKQVETVTDKRQ